MVDESNAEAGALPFFFLGPFGGVNLFLGFFGLGVIKFEHLKFITMNEVSVLLKIYKKIMRLKFNNKANLYR